MVLFILLLVYSLLDLQTAICMIKYSLLFQ